MTATGVETEIYSRACEVKPPSFQESQLDASQVVIVF